jgi:PKD repeat protein
LLEKLTLQIKFRIMKRYLFTLIAVLMFSLFMENGNAQNQSTKGKEFWLAFLDNAAFMASQLSVQISSENITTGILTIPGANYSQSFAVTPNSVTTLIIPGLLLSNTRTDEEIINHGIYILAEETITVFASNQASQTTDASIVLPLSSLGVDYRIIDYGGGIAEFLILATNDNTRVQIIPRIKPKNNRSAGLPFFITLNKGESYLVHAHNDHFYDIVGFTGSTIRSMDPCKPIAVFAGNWCASPATGTCDHLYEQLYPIKSWGKKYYTVPLMTRKADTYRIVSLYDNTGITLNGIVNDTLKNNSFKEILLSKASIIESNKPIGLAQYSNGYVFDTTVSDPFMLLISPEEQGLKNITFSTIAGGSSATHYVNIVTKTSNTNNISLNGAPLAGVLFQKYEADSFYSYAQVVLGANGGGVSYTLNSSGKFTAYVYGFGPYESYGFAAGGNMNNISLDFDVNEGLKPCKATPIQFQMADLFYNPISYFWDFGDGSTSTLKNPTHTYNSAGTYICKLIVQSGPCRIDSLEKTIIIDESTINATVWGDTSICEKQFANIGASGGTTYSWEPTSSLLDASSSSPIASPSQTTNYKVYIAKDGCVVIDSVQVDVQALPKAQFNFTKDSLQVDFSGTTTNGIYEWIWDFGDRSPQSFEKNPNHTYTQQGEFEITLIVKNDCGLDTIVYKVIVDGTSGSGGTTTSVKNISTPSNILKVYPNPATNQLFVEYDGINEYRQVNLRILNIMGQIVSEKNISATKTTISLLEMQSGMYIVQLISDNNMLVNTTFIKQ